MILDIQGNKLITASIFISVFIYGREFVLSDMTIHTATQNTLHGDIFQLQGCPPFPFKCLKINKKRDMG